MTKQEMLFRFSFAILFTILVLYYFIAFCTLFEEMFKDKKERELKTKKDLFYLLFPFPLIPKLLYQLTIHVKDGFVIRINKIKAFFKELE